MHCVAVGDMFVDESDFAKVLKDCYLFDQYTGLSWKKDLDRTSTRALIRKIETEGSRAYVLDPDMENQIAQADVLFIHMCPVYKEIIEKAKHLKYILTVRGGVENIDVEACKARGIQIIHCPMHNAHAVAELTVGLMICETRNVTRSNYALKHGVWQEQYPNSGRIREIRSLTIGLIGFGAIGQLVASLLKPFDCKILVSDPFLDKKIIENYGCVPVDKETLLKESDIVSLHGRIGPNDPPIIGKEELRLMKPTSYLINTARAVLVDMDALYIALKNKEITGAALDVFPHEPLTKEDSITTLDNCTITNHRGGDTLDSYIRAPEVLLEQFKELLATGTTRYLIK